MNPFDAVADRYDAWFDSPHGKILFANEVAALRALLPESFRPALEIGVGTGRFAQALGIEQGVDVAAGALPSARRRGVLAQRAHGEVLPFADGVFRGAALITSLSFMAGPAGVLREARRVLVPQGHVLIAEIPRDSPWGQHCQSKKEAGDPFFATMQPLSVDEIVGLLAASELKPLAFASTLIRSTPDSPQPEEPVASRIDGAGFVGVLARCAQQ